MKVMWDFHAFPLWCDAPSHPVAPALGDVPVSDALREDLQTWSDEMTALRWGPRGPDDPKWSGPEAAEVERLNGQGLRLAQRLRGELGHAWAVTYHYEVTGEAVRVSPA